MNFDIAFAERRTSQLFPLTYQWQPDAIRSFCRPPPQTRKHTFLHMSYCLSANTHTRITPQSSVKHTNLIQQTHTILIPAAQAPACPRYFKFSKAKLFPRNPGGLAAQGSLTQNDFLEKLLQTQWSGSNLGRTVWLRGQSADEDPGGRQKLPSLREAL